MFTALFGFLKRLFGNKNGPKAVAVSEALEVIAGPYSDTLENAIAIVDGVHKDGRLPRIPIGRTSLKKMHGSFRAKGGRAAAISIDILTDHAELTTIHEIGHFLDYAGIGNSGTWASVRSDDLAAWRKAVAKSAAVQGLKHFHDIPMGKVTERNPDGSMVEYLVDKAYVEYLLEIEELWARSYAQFIVAKSAHPDLRDQLHRLRDRPARGLYYGQQWDDEDFLPIMAAMESAFRQFGWLQ